MSSIETFIKTMLILTQYRESSQTWVPSGLRLLQQLDILVSFSDYNDCFIIRGDGVTKI